TQEWEGSLRLRLGTLVTPWTLAYGTAGGAVGSVCGSFSYAATLTSPGTPGQAAVTRPQTPPLPPIEVSPAIPGVPGFTTSASGADNWCETRVGYTVGAGVDTAIALGYNSKLRFE